MFWGDNLWFDLLSHWLSGILTRSLVVCVRVWTATPVWTVKQEGRQRGRVVGILPGETHCGRRRGRGGFSTMVGTVSPWQPHHVDVALWCKDELEMMPSAGRWCCTNGAHRSCCVEPVWSAMSGSSLQHTASSTHPGTRTSARPTSWCAWANTTGPSRSSWPWLPSYIRLLMSLIGAFANFQVWARHREDNGDRPNHRPPKVQLEGEPEPWHRSAAPQTANSIQHCDPPHLSAQQEGRQDVRATFENTLPWLGQSKYVQVVYFFFFTGRLMTTGFKGRVTGWGNLMESFNPAARNLPTNLQQIHLPIAEEDVCRSSTSIRITDNMFCAGNDWATSV